MILCYNVVIYNFIIYLIIWEGNVLLGVFKGRTNTLLKWRKSAILVISYKIDGLLYKNIVIKKNTSFIFKQDD